MRSRRTKSRTIARTRSSITPERNQQEIQEGGGTDFGFADGTAARFRVSIFRQRGDLAIVCRQIPNRLLTFEQNRLVKVRVGSESHPVATYSYNGLNQRVARLASPVLTTATITQANLYYYDAMWRLLEERVDDGYTVSGTPSPFPLAPTGSSMSVDRIVQRIWGLEYIDQFLCMQTDVGSGGAPDGDFTNATPYYALTDRLYNVVGMLNDASPSIVQERVRYTAYGVARRVDTSTLATRSDWNGDGVTDFLDLNAYLAFTASGGGTLASTTSAYDPEFDFNLDNVVDFADLNAILSNYDTTHAVYRDGEISTQTIDNTVGFAGYMFDPATGFYLARHRWHDPAMGRWVNRDPQGYLDSGNLFAYCLSSPATSIDPLGWKATKQHDNLKGFPVEAGAVGAVTACLNLCSGDVSVSGWWWAGIGVNTALGWMGWSKWDDFATKNYGPLLGAFNNRLCGDCDPCCKGAWNPQIPGFLTVFVGHFGGLASIDGCSASLEFVAYFNFLDKFPIFAAPIKVANFLGVAFEAGAIFTAELDFCRDKGGGVALSNGSDTEVCAGGYFEIGVGLGPNIPRRRPAKR